MTRPTTDNITGVESYDHSELAALLEYEVARLALDQLVKALERHEVDLTARSSYPSAQGAWLQVVTQMAASLPYADECPACSCGDQGGLHWPYQTTVDGDWLTGRYRCGHCGHRWSCGYAVNAPLYAP
jgi:DNA-directed RNA polymerase subunit M/transcription elongation factor TFIIS